MTTAWRRLPDRLGHVRLTGPRPALRTATGEFLRLHRVPEAGRAPRRAYLREVADFARERAAEQNAARWPEGRRRVLVLGRDNLARGVAAELRRLGADVERRKALPQLLPEAGRHAALVIAVDERGLGALGDDRLTSLPPRAAVLQGRGEGGSFLLMPLAVDGTEATADQVRRRRIAASSAGDELGAWLDAPHPVRLPPAVAALAAARLVGAALAWASGTNEVDVLRRTLTVVHPDLRVTRHVVLGFDEPPARTGTP